MGSVASLWRDEGGQDLIEYALLAALISVFCVAAISALGVKIDTYYQTDVEAKIP
jgi:pilus assembly protein Flp/PilA